MIFCKILLCFWRVKKLKNLVFEIKATFKLASKTLFSTTGIGYFSEQYFLITE
jgi:hypothetical protein